MRALYPIYGGKHKTDSYHRLCDRRNRLHAVQGGPGQPLRVRRLVRLVCFFSVKPKDQEEQLFEL